MSKVKDHVISKLEKKRVVCKCGWYCELKAGKTNQSALLYAHERHVADEVTDGKA